ncbi:NUDIX hydrolase [Jiangella alkaliphila]|uniref:ADP-ribose pyrophosphatase YjhB, NUDIX family n=1 Tax=Jiangella alkaliphila TaxID=419479 RepID=A0A1H2KWX9_9ACTN|nr:NUDIX domain-containing protein [Jiangella alkaliphila]SDU72908.1 ADP-ribose pyrophosphatase YjhB, NUDIX family [Jiangella alkaliphila]
MVTPRPEPEHRRAARVIVVDEAGRVLLMRGYDPADPSNVWWITPGGGLEPGEDERAGAVRELFEESGLRVGPDELAGPVAVRTAFFSFMGRPYRQDEVLFFARLTGATDVDGSGWTDIERASVTELRWCAADEVEALGEPVYPPALPSIVRGLVGHGWDGTTRTVG